MLEKLLNKIKLIFILLYFLVSIILYFILDYLHQIEANNLIKEYAYSSSVTSLVPIWKSYLIMDIFVLIVFLIIYLTLRYFFIQLAHKDELLAKQSRFAALGEMISMIAHQWRQPLTGMGMSVNNLLLDVELGELNEKNLQKKLERISTQISYLSNTIDNFKNFFKPTLKSQVVEIKKLIEDACSIIESSLKSSGIIIDIYIDETLTLSTKKNDLTQIVLNLIQNSMDAYKEVDMKVKKIEITVLGDSKHVSIIVKDYAGGIPSEILENIFDPYFSTKDAKNGTGLGLYMSKMIVEDHLSGHLNVVVKENSSIFTIVLNKKEEF